MKGNTDEGWCPGTLSVLEEDPHTPPSSSQHRMPWDFLILQEGETADEERKCY